ncbi:hypothetical protein [Neptunicella sp. SCSIO 80796]|uniref:hypothetical protein n=1 Tax=Neptunicella plasticusilytica TaxID=3117012 RepID=UPI003A4DE413
MKPLLLLLGLIYSGWAAADCSYAILKDNLQQKVIDGVSYWIVAQSQVNPQCIDISAIADDLDTLKQYKNLLLQYKQHDDSLADSISGFRELLTNYDRTSDDLMALTRRYDQHISQYDKLSQDFNDLLVDYNELIKKYRNIALNQSSPFSFDVGAGLSEKGDFSGLFGVGYQKVRVWGVYQDGQSALMVGTRITF